MTTPLPPADARYERDLNVAFHARGKVLLRLLAQYARIPGLREAMDWYNQAVADADVEGTLRRAIVAAQDSLRARDEARRAEREPSFIGGLPEDRQGVCAGCEGVMLVYEPGQRYHPMCEPAQFAPRPAEPVPGMTLEASSEWPADTVAPPGEPDEDW